MKFADNGDVREGWTLTWEAGSPLHGDQHVWHFLTPPAVDRELTDPFCFGGKATPTVAILLRIESAFPIPNLRIQGEEANGNKMSATARDIQDAVSFKVVESRQTKEWPAQVWNGHIRWNWRYDFDDLPEANASLGSTEHQVFLTYGKPIVDTSQRGIPVGTNVTARRIDKCTEVANGKKSPTMIGDAIGPQATSGRLFFNTHSVNGGAPMTTVWEILDRHGGGDCVSLATLMKAEVDMLGATGSKVEYVYACHRDWSHLSSQFANANEYDDSHTNKLGMYFGSRYHGAAGDTHHGGGWNNYEGCCEFDGKWWMGGFGKSKPSAKEVLWFVVRPNDVNGTVEDHQCYENDMTQCVSRPPE